MGNRTNDLYVISINWHQRATPSLFFPLAATSKRGKLFWNVNNDDIGKTKEQGPKTDDVMPKEWKGIKNDDDGAVAKPLPPFARTWTTTTHRQRPLAPYHLNNGGDENIR